MKFNDSVDFYELNLNMDHLRSNISHYHLVNLTASDYNDYCYLKVDGNKLSNITDYCYSYAESLIAGVGATLQSVVGVTLNILVIIALLRTKSVRNEYITPAIVSLIVTDLLFSMFTLPMLAVRYFLGYVLYKLNFGQSNLELICSKTIEYI